MEKLRSYEVSIFGEVNDLQLNYKNIKNNLHY